MIKENTSHCHWHLPPLLIYQLPSPHYLSPTQLVSKLRAAQAEIADYEEEQRRDRERLAIAVEELQKELSLR